VQHSVTRIDNSAKAISLFSGERWKTLRVALTLDFVDLRRALGNQLGVAHLPPPQLVKRNTAPKWRNDSTAKAAVKQAVNAEEAAGEREEAHR
jgi:hypothetical protein